MISERRVLVRSLALIVAIGALGGFSSNDLPIITPQTFSNQQDLAVLLPAESNPPPPIAPAPPVVQEPTKTAPTPAVVENVEDLLPERMTGTMDLPSGHAIQEDQSIGRPNADRVPVYNSFDFMAGYLSNLTSPIIVDGKPWDFGSTNMVELKEPGGGTSYWDYWSETESWDSPNHLWYDDDGNPLTYLTETIKDASGKAKTAYVLFEKQGPGVMDKLWFTQDPTRSFLRILTQVDLFLSPDPPEVMEWGRLAKLGNLRIEVDSGVVYDGPIKNWFSGDAQDLPPVLREVLVWHYRQFGSNGNIIPIPYRKSLKVSVYGGEAKPKWFMATGVTLPAGMMVQSYSGIQSAWVEKMTLYARNIVAPENYIDSVGRQQSYDLTVQKSSPALLQTSGAGTINAIRLKIAKSLDPKKLALRVTYGNEVGIDLPLLAFFSEPDQLSLHHSTPIGVIESGDSYLFYSNLPLPYQDGIAIQFDSSDPAPAQIQLDLATTDQTTNTQLRIRYKPDEKLQVYGPDFGVDIAGNGKLVGLVLVTKDQQFDLVPRVMDKRITHQEDNSKRRWPMGYLEGNLTIKDGAGNTRYYSGQEDWAEGGYYFNSGYTTPPGGSNRPFAGILRYREGKDGYATLFRYFNDLAAFRFKNGLHLAFGHGTWNNNFPVTYAAIAFYYLQVPGALPQSLPALDYMVTSGDIVSGDER